MPDRPADSTQTELHRVVEARLREDGWETDVEAVASGTYRIAGLDPATSTRRLVLVVPSETVTVTGEQLEWLADRAASVDADVVEVTTEGVVDDDARQLAGQHGITVRSPGEFRQPPANQPPPGRPQRSQPQQPAQTGQGTQPAPGQPQGGQGPARQPPQGKPQAAQGRGGNTHQQQAPQGPPGQQQAPQGPPGQQQRQPTQVAPGQQAATGTGWPVTRIVTLGGGVLGGVAMVLPWAVAIEASMDWNGLATQMSPFILAGVAISVLAPAVAWGDGWGRLTSLLSAVAGAGMAFLGFSINSSLAERTTIGYIELDGNEVPIAAVESGTGVELFMLAGVVVLLGGLAGLVSSFT